VLLLVSTLMEFKSRALLPADDVEEEIAEDDSARQELVRQLLEYRRYRMAANLLEERAAQQRERVPRLSTEDPFDRTDPAAEPIRELELWDLLAAFSRLMKANVVPVAASIAKDPTPIREYMRRLEEAVLESGGIEFERLLGLTNTRAQLIGKFLAVLELIKSGRVWVEWGRGDDIVFLPPRRTIIGDPADADLMAMEDATAPPDVAGRSSPDPTSLDDSTADASADGGVRAERARGDEPGEPEERTRPSSRSKEGAARGSDEVLLEEAAQESAEDDSEFSRLVWGEPGDPNRSAWDHFEPLLDAVERELDERPDGPRSRKPPRNDAPEATPGTAGDEESPVD
jgi:segregation and condensation protein A